MPGFDRTGPEGKGSRTGRGLGKCNPNNKSDDTDTREDNVTGRLGRAFGRGRGLGRGMGRGRR